MLETKAQFYIRYNFARRLYKISRIARFKLALRGAAEGFTALRGSNRPFPTHISVTIVSPTQTNTFTQFGKDREIEFGAAGAAPVRNALAPGTETFSPEDVGQGHSGVSR